MQYSDQFKAIFITKPSEAVPASDWNGRLRLRYFKLTGASGGGTDSTIVRLPAGTTRFLGALSWVKNSGIVSIGWAEHEDIDGNTVAADPNGINNALAAGEGRMGAALDASTRQFRAKEGVDITATLTAETDTLEGWIAYAQD